MADSDEQALNPILWNADTEVCLFYAMRGFKPVGINKHFHMMGIHKKFVESIGHSITSAQLWEHLASMYNLTVLDESQAIPFVNNIEEFKLPDEMLNSDKEVEKPKDTQTEQSREPPKSSTGSAKDVVSKTATPAKGARKRTRATPGQGGGAVGPGSNKRKRH